MEFDFDKKYILLSISLWYAKNGMIVKEWKDKEYLYI